jgi:hypothetical protein
MVMHRMARSVPWFALAVTASAACSSSSSPGTATSEGGALGGSQLCYQPPADVISSDAGTLKTFTPPCDPGANAFAISISGEANAIVGYAYPPYDLSTATYMVDGWNWQIDRYIVVIDHITLWTNPNESASDQSQHGPQIAHLDGPFVVDLHKGGPLDGKGGAGEEAVAIGAILDQNDNGNMPFDASTTYAFGFSTVQATYDAINVNLTSDEQADFDYMVQNGASVYYHGTANWNGTQSGGQTGFGICSTNPQTDYANMAQTCAVAGSGGGDAGASGDAAEADDGGSEGTCASIYNFDQLPQSMTFQFAFPTPTNYVNCVNYSASEVSGMTIRGVQTSTSQSVINQVTVHMDHPFWESFEEDTPVHWDDIAAQYIGQTNPTAHLDDFKGVPFHPFTDHNGVTMPWHWCETAYSPPGEGAMSFSTLSVPINPQGTCTGVIGVDYKSPMDNCPAIRDYYDFIRYTQSTQGHLNSQGLCFIDRQYPAPGGGS